MEKKKTFDVTKPGKRSPESTSRPILVSNRSIVQDPTLKQGDEASADPEVAKVDEINKVSNQAKTIKPIDVDIDEEPKKEAEKPEPEDETKAEPTDDRESSDNDQELDQTINDKKKANKQDAEDKARQEVVEKLVAEGKYVVPIGQIKRRRNLRNALMLIALLLIVGVVAGDLLIDAGIIKTDIKPVVNLINN